MNSHFSACGIRRKMSSKGFPGQKGCWELWKVQVFVRFVRLELRAPNEVLAAWNLKLSGSVLLCVSFSLLALEQASVKPDGSEHMGNCPIKWIGSIRPGEVKRHCHNHVVAVIGQVLSRQAEDPKSHWKTPRKTFNRAVSVKYSWS